MKKVILAFVLSSATLLNAQPGKTISPSDSKETIQKANDNEPNIQAFSNSAEISKALEISESVAPKVWITYEEYNRAKEQMKTKHRSVAKETRSALDSEEAKDEQYEAAFRSRLEAKRDRLDLDETYYNKFLEILPASKVQILLVSERKARQEARGKLGRQAKGQPRMNQTR